MRPSVSSLRSLVSGGFGLLGVPNSTRTPASASAHQRLGTEDRSPKTRHRLARLSVLRTATTSAALVVAGSSRVFACPMCFGAEESGLIDGAKLGVLVLVAITVAVQGGFVGFFLYLRNRAKRIADLELEDEWMRLQRGSRTS